MRLLLLLTGLLNMSMLHPLLAQPRADSSRGRPPAPTAASSWSAFSAGRSRLDQRGLVVLGAWAAGNLLVSGIATGQTESSAHYFHQMNLGWGAVNLALAGTGYLAARRTARQPSSDRADNVRSQLRTENLYLLNAGLDVAYLATGLYLLEKSRNPTAPGSADRWRGYGQSLLVQGGFLLLFDGFQYGRHHQHGRDLYPLLSRLSIAPGTVAVRLPLGGSAARGHNSPTDF
ncbi:hypothetical protein IC235_08160 [Hymenobacter sp. BT664]|uniref:Uncharacterized protein n=1 Tax=Hymenobacter montanus TaxID=2771359 RepID=A0A927BCQ1_9BACT|nr:hypothetical protein [Hymenobacter montanus]MBD2767865.1 hypothetical protein [Hymenobacter montanus]